MNLSQQHRELLDSYGGYKVREDERSLYHIMFVKIIQPKGGGRSTDQANFQKYHPREWETMKKNIEQLGILVTGYNEYTVLHDPTEKPKVEPKPKAAPRAKRAAPVSKTPKA